LEACLSVRQRREQCDGYISTSGIQYRSWLLNLFYKAGAPATHSGFSAYNRKAVELMQPSEIRFGVDSETLCRALKLNLKVVEVLLRVEYKAPKPSKRGSIYHWQ